MHEPACIIDGKAYAEIPVFKKQRAFEADGAPNPAFDWKGFRMAFQKPMSKSKIRSIRLKRASRALTGEYDVGALNADREKIARRKATRKAARRKAFVKAVADAVVAKLWEKGWDKRKRR
jgi:hypothetical protein